MDATETMTMLALRRWLKFTKWVLLATTALYFILASLNVYMALDHNPQGESCRYVNEGEWYHLRLEGNPCRVTGYALLIFFATYAIPAIPTQGPFLILYYVLRRQSKRRMDMSAECYSSHSGEVP